MDFCRLNSYFALSAIMISENFCAGVFLLSLFFFFLARISQQLLDQQHAASSSEAQSWQSSATWFLIQRFCLWKYCSSLS